MLTRIRSPLAHRWQVPDPAAIAPEDWEEDEDGEWEAPLVRNPQCAPPGGCGKWRPPMVKNPHYKGKWKAAKIQNPAYRGEWRADIVDNPHWFYDPQPHAMAPIGGVGIDLFTNVVSTPPTTRQQPAPLVPPGVRRATYRAPPRPRRPPPRAAPPTRRIAKRRSPRPSRPSARRSPRGASKPRRRRRR